MLACIKVGDNGLVVQCKGATSSRECYPVQIKPILHEISDKILGTITTEAIRLVLVKC